jgi:hypothetical protein
VDAIIIHSGHLIFSRHAQQIALDVDGTVNVETAEACIRSTLGSVAQSLVAAGRFLVNIEVWDDRTYEYPDGSIYTRRVVGHWPEPSSPDEDDASRAERLGPPVAETRVHTFDDAPSGLTFREPIERRPKISIDKFSALADEAGFAPESLDSQAGFVVLRKLG